MAHHPLPSFKEQPRRQTTQPCPAIKASILRHPKAPIPKAALAYPQGVPTALLLSPLPDCAAGLDKRKSSQLTHTDLAKLWPSLVCKRVTRTRADSNVPANRARRAPEKQEVLGFCQLDKNWLYLRRRKQTEKMQKSRWAQGSHASHQQRLRVPLQPNFRRTSAQLQHSSPCHPSFRESAWFQTQPSCRRQTQCSSLDAPHPDIRHSAPQHRRDLCSRFTAHAWWGQRRCFFTQKA